METNLANIGLFKEEKKSLEEKLAIAKGYYDRGLFQEALLEYEGLSVDPKAGWIGALAASRILRKMGLTQRANSYLRDAVLGSPRDLQEARLELCQQFRISGRYEDALSILFLHVGEDWRIDQEIVLSAYQSEYYWKDGRKVCDRLGLGLEVPPEIRAAARTNLYWYLSDVSSVLESWRACRLDFDPPEGYVCMNPSVALWNGRLMALVRTINYWVMKDSEGHTTWQGQPSHSRNFLFELESGGLDAKVICEVQGPVDLPEAKWPGVLGFEDLRLIPKGEELWVVGTCREQNLEGLTEQWLARLDLQTGRMVDWRALESPGRKRHEKNWMPILDGEQRTRFLYTVDPTLVVDGLGYSFAARDCLVDVKHWSGSSQLIPFDNGWLGVVHSRLWIDGWPKYYHRLVWLNEEFELKKSSWPFAFKTDAARQIQGYQFVMGLAWHPDGQRLIMSYNRNESESWFGIFDTADAKKSLRDLEGKENWLDSR